MILKINANHYHVHGCEQENGRKINTREYSRNINRSGKIKVVLVVYCPFDWRLYVHLNRKSTI